jgi:uncharacterized protein
MEKIVTMKRKEELKLSGLKKGVVHRLSMNVSTSPLGLPWFIPVLVARGLQKGPTLGITAAVHGNELNGLPTIFKLFEKINLEELAGTLIAVPVMNIPGFLAKQREFSDKKDLNRVMPGKEYGPASDMYAYQFTQKIVKKFDFLLDLHTASFGRVNSLYVRADLDNPVCKVMAELQKPQIIVQKYDEEGTLRAWANNQGIPSITIEIGNPYSFQPSLIDSTYEGILNFMRYLKMVPGDVDYATEETLICEHSYWVYSYIGGVVDVFPSLTNFVKKGEVIGRVYDIYGEVLSEVTSPEEGYVIGKNVNPVCESGSRILHLGILSSR